jgi:hypothetical protein
LLVAARNGSSGWQLEKLRNWGEAEDSFVERLPPGDYRMTEASDGVSEADEVASLKSERDGIGAGRIESSEIGFFYSRHRWTHLWLSD